MQPALEPLLGDGTSGLPASTVSQLKLGWEEGYQAWRQRDPGHCRYVYLAKYPGAVECLQKDRELMLAFCDFPAAHWQHIRTTNPIGPVFATVRLGTNKTKNCGSRTTTLAMAWKLMATAQRKWRRLRGYKLLADVVQGVKFKDGGRVGDDQPQGATDSAVRQI